MGSRELLTFPSSLSCSLVVTTVSARPGDWLRTSGSVHWTRIWAPKNLFSSDRACWSSVVWPPSAHPPQHRPQHHETNTPKEKKRKKRSHWIRQPSTWLNGRPSKATAGQIPTPALVLHFGQERTCHFRSLVSIFECQLLTGSASFAWFTIQSRSQPPFVRFVSFCPTDRSPIVKANGVTTLLHNFGLNHFVLLSSSLI